jgi:hypothetical protein
MRSPIWYSSLGTRSLAGMTPSASPRSTIDIAAFEAPDGAGDDVADVVLVDGEDLVLFGHAQLLDDGLLGGLGGDAPEIAGGDLDFDQVAELVVFARIFSLGVVHGDFFLAVADEVDDLDAGIGPDVQGFAVEFHAQVADAADAFAAGHLQGGFDQLGQGFAVELALPLHIFKYSQQFVVHFSNLLTLAGEKPCVPTPDMQKSGKNPLSQIRQSCIDVRKTTFRSMGRQLPIPKKRARLSSCGVRH